MAFKITANPKFDANLTFTAQGADLKCKVTFRHMGRKAFESLFATVFDNRKDPVGAEADAVLAVVDSWDIEALKSSAMSIRDLGLRFFRVIRKPSSPISRETDRGGA